MSLKATKLALELLKSMSEHGSVNHGVACRAEKELAALEKAANAWCRPMAVDRTEWEKMGQVLTAIAKEAK